MEIELEIDETMGKYGRMDGLTFHCPIKRAHKRREREEIITVFFGFLTEHKKRESRTPKVIVRE